MRDRAAGARTATRMGSWHWKVEDHPTEPSCWAQRKKIILKKANVNPLSEIPKQGSDKDVSKLRHCFPNCCIKR